MAALGLGEPPDYARSRIAREDGTLTDSGGKETWRLSIPNAMAAVAGANRSLEAFLHGRNANQELVFSAVLALEEVVTNVIKYSYEDDLPHEIALEATLDAEGLVLRVADDGREFDPLSVSPPDFDKPPEERDVGGLGVHLLRNLAQRVKYKRHAGRNVLTLFLQNQPKEN